MTKKQNMSVGFADLTRYAMLVNTVGSEKALEYLRKMFKTAGDAILRRGGRIRKYIGDTILFTFDDPRQAVRAAEEIAGKCRHKVSRFVLRYHVAIATGEVLVGKIGHPAFLVEDVMGRTVNCAACLIPKAMRSRSGVAICPETRRLLRG